MTEDTSTTVETAEGRVADADAEVLRGLVERLVTDSSLSPTRAIQHVRALLRRAEQTAELGPAAPAAAFPAQTSQHDAAERLRELSALLEVSRRLSSTLDLDRLLDVVLDQIKVVAGYDGATIAALEGDTVRILRRRAPAAVEPAASAWDVSAPRGRAAPGWDSTLRREPVIIGDVRGEEPLALAYRAGLDVPLEQSTGHYVRSWMAVPLALTDRVIGRIVLASTEPHHYTDRHATIVTAFATHAAVAIENARLYEQERRTAMEMASLLEVSRNLASTLDLEPLLDVILDQLHVVADFTSCAVLIVDGDDLRTVAYRGPFPRERAFEQRFSLDRVSILWQAALRREAVLIDDIYGDTPFARTLREAGRGPLPPASTYHIRSWLAVPLIQKDETIGTIVITHGTPGYYTAHHAELITAIATQAAAAIENARLYAQTEQRTRELGTLLGVSQSLSSTLALKPLLGLILDQLKIVADYSSSSILTVDGAEVVQRDFRWPGIPASQIPEQRQPIERIAPIWDIIRRREAVNIADVRGDSPAARAYRQVVGAGLDTSLSYVHSWMAVPMALKDRVIGLITLAKDVPNFYTPGHVTLATAIAGQAAIAIENARLYGEAHKLAALEERQRLARELHDSVSQSLFGIGLGARTAQTLLQRGQPDKALGSVDYVVSLADGGMAEMRALLFEMRPESLAAEGLVAAITKQAAVLRLRHELMVDLELCDEPDVSLDTKEALYRIAQEALHNIVKHARARTVTVQLSSDATGIALAVRDDGAGFDPSGSFPGHLGQHSMRERAVRLGGSIAVESAPGEGTCVRVLIPPQR
jgi:signal transduction histidine kinase